MEVGEVGGAYDSLAAKYGSFMVPSMAIRIDGQDMASSLGLLAQGVSVGLSLNGPSNASFQVWDCYDLPGHSIKAAVKEALKPGSQVEVDLGYGSDQTKVFSGYIQQMQLEMGQEESFSYQVTAVDVRQMMKDGGKRYRVLQVDTYAEAFTQVMGDYSAYCRAEAGSMEGKLEQGLLQNGTDLDFIENVLLPAAPGWEFWVENGTAYFKERDADKTVVAEFRPGGGLMGLSWSCGYLNRRIQAIGYSVDLGMFTAEETVKGEVLSDCAVEQLEVLMLPQADTQEKVEKAAAARAGERKGEASQLSLTVTGLPELTPGSWVQVEAVDGQVDGIYRVTEVKHQAGESGFSSQLTVEGDRG